VGGNRAIGEGCERGLNSVETEVLSEAEQILALWKPPRAADAEERVLMNIFRYGYIFGREIKEGE
jgi:hypothetical protein